MNSNCNGDWVEGGQRFARADRPLTQIEQVGFGIVCGVEDIEGESVYRICEAMNSHKPLLEALELAEGFISGFEDDEDQEGMDFLLSTIRAAISKATGHPTERLFVVTEVVQYEVMAHSEAEAVNFIKEHDDRNDYVVSVSERDAVEKGGE